MTSPRYHPWVGDRLAIGTSRAGPHTIAVGGSLLGTGASTASALLALAAAARGRETLLVDADPEGSVLPVLLGARGGQGIDVHARTSGAGELLRLRDGLHLLRPASPESRPRLRGDLLDRFDAVIVDAGWRVDSVLETCAAEVDRVLVVTTPGRAALSACYGLIKTVETRFPGTRFEVLVNQQHVYAAGRPFDHLQSAALHFLRRMVSLAGVVQEDPCLRAGTRGGMTVEDAAAESNVAHVMERLMERILAEWDRSRLLPPVQRHLLGGGTGGSSWTMP